MILSMKPPYDITPKILKLITSISEKLGEINATYGEFNNLMQQMINFIFVELWKNYAGD